MRSDSIVSFLSTRWNIEKRGTFFYAHASSDDQQFEATYSLLQCDRLDQPTSRPSTVPTKADPLKSIRQTKKKPTTIETLRSVYSSCIFPTFLFLACRTGRLWGEDQLGFQTSVKNFKLEFFLSLLTIESKHGTTFECVIFLFVDRLGLSNTSCLAFQNSTLFSREWRNSDEFDKLRCLTSRYSKWQQTNPSTKSRVVPRAMCINGKPTWSNSSAN